MTLGRVLSMRLETIPNTVWTVVDVNNKCSHFTTRREAREYRRSLPDPRNKLLRHTLVVQDVQKTS